MENNRVDQEFADVQLGDERLNRRIVKMAKPISHRIEKSINRGMKVRADSKVAYRFFDHRKVSGKKILQSHQRCTRERLKGHDRVLVIQDTSFYTTTAMFGFGD